MARLPAAARVRPRQKPAAPTLAGQNAAYFGEAYYALYHGGLLPARQNEAEADFLLHYLRPGRAARWLDAPCGYGRHLLALARRRPDLRLHGLDLNARYLREPGLARAARLARGDLRALPWRGGTFHVALALLNSFGYFDEGDNRRMLGELARVLRPGGRLVLDLANRQALLGLVREQPAIRYCVGEREAEEHFAWDVASERLHNVTHWRGPDGAHTAGYNVRLYTPAQARRLLAAHGLVVEAEFGDFSGEAFSPAQSERLLLVARRPAAGRSVPLG